MLIWEKMKIQTRVHTASRISETNDVNIRLLGSEIWYFYIPLSLGEFEMVIFFAFNYPLTQKVRKIIATLAVTRPS